MTEGKLVINADGSYLYQRQQKQTVEIITTVLPNEPLAGWEFITADNCEEMAKKSLPWCQVYTQHSIVTSNIVVFIVLLYTYLAEGTGKQCQLVIGYSMHFNVDTITGHLAI